MKEFTVVLKLSRISLLALEEETCEINRHVSNSFIYFCLVSSLLG